MKRFLCWLVVLLILLCPVGIEAGIFGLRSSGCTDGSCAVAATVAKPATKPAAVKPAAPAALTPPLIPNVQPKAPDPAPPVFPGPTPTAPRVLFIWDNGVVWDSGAKVWWWQDKAGTWLHQP